MPIIRRILLYIYFCFASCKLKNHLLRWFAFHPSKRPYYQFREASDASEVTQSEVAATDTRAHQSKMSEMQLSINPEEYCATPFRKVSRGASLDIKTFLEVDSRDFKFSPPHKKKGQRYDVYIQRSPNLTEIFKHMPNDVETEGFYLDTQFGQLAVMLLQPLFSESHYLILHSHPNQPDMGEMFELYLKLCYNLNVSVLGYDYPGFGLSEGSPSEESLYASIERTYQFAKEMGYKEDQIILYGHSIGNGPTIHLASKFKVAGVVLHSCFKSLLNILSPLEEDTKYDAFRNYLLVDLIRCPVYMIHGKEDEMIPISQAIQISQKIRNLYKFWQVPGAGHNNIEHDENLKLEYLENLNGFMNSIRNTA